MKKKVRPIAVSTPVNLKTEEGIYLSFHEANLTDYAGMKLGIKKRDKKYVFESDLIPWPDGVKVIGKTPFNTPWRTIQINDEQGGLITSNLIVNLNEPCAIEDVSRIEPMKYMGIWWGYHIGKYSFDYPGTKTKPHGATTENAKERNVKIIVHNETMGRALNYENQLDTAYKLYKSLGVNAIKTGYAWFIEEGKYYHHSQWMVRHYHKVSKKKIKKQ